MLGLWDQQQQQLQINSSYSRNDGTKPLTLTLTPTQFPPLDQLPAAIASTLDYHIKVTPIEWNDRHWGYFAYAEAPGLSSGFL
ncbi:MAG: hypothetical protein Fur005_25930 [Roseiflexaceae bacterium]